MDAGSILLILAMIVGVALFISQPFFTRQVKQKLVTGISDQERDHRRSALLAEHERALSALQELEFDYTLGKIPAEDYPAQRAALLNNGAQALRQLDELEPADHHDTAEVRMEAAVAARRMDGRRGSHNSAADTDDELENLIAARRRAREEKSTGFCPQCGRPLQKSDRFCSRCGTTISA